MYQYKESTADLLKNTNTNLIHYADNVKSVTTYENIHLVLFYLQ